MTLQEIISNSKNAKKEASDAAKVIFDYSTNCLMAHSIRAFQQHLLDRYNAHFDIVIKRQKGLGKLWKRKSWVYFFSGGSVIVVDKEELHDQQRICIAHELFHLILATKYEAGNDKNQHKLVNEEIPRCAEIENLCDIFANDLCTLHHKFYESGEAVRKGIFSNLPIHSSSKS